MKNLKTSIPGLIVIICGVLLFLRGDGSERVALSATALVFGGLGLLNAADAKKVDRNGPN